MVSWSNWSGRQKSRPQKLQFLRSEQDARAVAAQAVGSEYSIRIAGAGHSHSPLVVHDSVIVDVSGLSGVIDIDSKLQRAWIWAGSRIYSLGRPLHDAGLAMKNIGDIDRQAIAGACATGTHGTGRNLQNLSAAITGVRIALASGELLDCSAEANADAWQVARLNLGALGIVTRLQLQLCDAYKLKETGFSESYDALIPKVEDLIEENERFEFFWYPQTDLAVAKIINQTDAEAQYPLAEEGARLAWNYEVLPNHRPHLHTEMEYSVPAMSGLACFAAIRELLQKKFPDVSWPVEYRTVAADDVWLSMAFERATVTISVHQDIREDETAYYRACEAIFLSFGGRPHWGKVNYLDATQLAEAHPRWQQWWFIRDQYDPEGVFLNKYLEDIRPV